jgi:signal transduction histidine kinase
VEAIFASHELTFRRRIALAPVEAELRRHQIITNLLGSPLKFTPVRRPRAHDRHLRCRADPAQE